MRGAPPRTVFSCPLLDHPRPICATRHSPSATTYGGCRTRPAVEGILSAENTIEGRNATHQFAVVEDDLRRVRMSCVVTLGSRTYHSVIVLDGRKPVRDCQHRHTFVQLLAERLLDHSVGLIICSTISIWSTYVEVKKLTDRGRGLVHEEDLALPHDGACQSDYLPLAC